MSSPRASAEGLALGDQRTPLSAEVDPTEQCRSTELEQYSMRDARSDKSTQTTIAAQVLPPMPGLAEKGHGNPDHHPPPGPHTSRHNSMDSNASSVGGGSYYSAPSPGNKIKRSSTGWTSVATASSVATSIIEEEEEEPDVLSLKEQAEEPFGLDGHFGLDEHYASSDSPQATPSQGGNDFEFKRFFGRSLTYQSPTPSRSSSINEDFDFAASSTTHKVHPFSSSPRPNSPAQRIATMPKYKRDKAPMGLRLDSAMRRDSLPLRSRVEHPSPSRLRRQATDQLCGPSAVGVGAPRPHSKLAQDWEPASPTNPATPVSEEPEGEEDDTEMGESELPTPVADHDEDMAGDSADGSSGCGSHPGTPPSLEGNTPVGSPKSDSSSLRHMHHDQMHHDQDMVGAICDLILERTHGVRLRDLTTSDDAWQAVNYCLEELGRIVDVNAALPGQTSIPIRETPAGYNHGGPSGYEPWNGCAGGSGSQGRHNGGQDGQLPQGGYGGGYGPDGSGGAGQGSNGTGKPSGKRNRDSDTLTTQYSCPYRKRNPARFNVRLHLPCATQSFPDISQVKRHVKTFHRRNTGLFLCIRCKRSFETESLHRRHLQQDPDKMCKVRDQAQEETNGDPELGVSSSIIDELNERKQNSKVDTWDGLWKKLFPMDEESREPTFIQPVELDEVKEDFAMMTRDLSAELRTHVGTLQPGSNATMVGDSVAQLCVQRIEETLRTSESRARGPLPSPKRRRHHHFGKRNSAGSTQLQAEHSSSSNMGSSPVDDGEPPELGELEGAQFGQPQGPAHVMTSFPQPGFPLMASAHQPVGITMATTVPLAPHMVMGPQNGSDNSKSVSPANSHEAYGMTTAMMPEGGLPAGYVEAPYHWPHPGPFSDGAGFDGSFSDNTDFNNTWDKDGAF